jgi:hypothetical protein
MPAPTKTTRVRKIAALVVSAVAVAATAGAAVAVSVGLAGPLKAPAPKAPAAQVTPVSKPATNAALAASRR